MNYFTKTKPAPNNPHLTVRAPHWARIIRTSTLVLLTAIFLFDGWYVVGSGSRGVMYEAFGGGVQEHSIDEGLYFKLPIFQHVTDHTIKQQTFKTNTVAASKDSQDVYLEPLVVRYHLDPAKVWWVHQNIGSDYENQVVRHVSIEAVKKATAQFILLDILPQRAEVEALATEFLAPELAKVHMVLDGVELVNIDFSESVRTSLELKEVARQKAIEEQYRLEQVRTQAEQKVVQAEADARAVEVKAQAEANKTRVINEQLAVSPLYLLYLQIQTWNGEFPLYFGGSDLSALFQIPGAER